MNTKFAKALKCARKTQAAYTALHVNSTQNVRNPIPLKEIIQKCLPILPGKTLKFVGNVSLKVFGVTIVRQVTVDLPTELTGLSNDCIADCAMTKRELIAVMRANGYLVNCEASIGQILTKMPDVRSIVLNGSNEKSYYLIDKNTYTF